MEHSNELLKSLDTIYSADSVEYLPGSSNNDEITPSSRGFLVVGTYQLLDPIKNTPILPKDLQPQDESTSTEEVSDLDNDLPAKRVGRILTLKLNDQDPIFDVTGTLDTDAILDLKWTYSKDSYTKGLLGQTDAKGNLVIYSWQNEKLSKVANQSFEHSTIEEKECLGLSLDWSDRLNSDSPYIATSHSDGSLAITEINQIENNYNLNIKNRWIGHDYEAWIIASNYFNNNIIYSGGDDCKLKVWDRRLLPEYDIDSPISSCTPSLVNKSHMMGVCSIQKHPFQEYTLASGSYDETVRLFDTRKLSRPYEEIALGGGVWRLKWHPEPSKSNLLLAGCMNNGYHIINIEDSDNFVKNSYHYHKSLAYGVDWCPASQPKQNDWIACASFYDHLFSIWNPSNQ